MRVLDLFCGAGGASEGYRIAGADVIGVDIVKYASYPFTFMKMDALEFLSHLINGGRWRKSDWDEGDYLDLSMIDFIHASPPCQLYSAGNRANLNNRHPDLVDPTRQLLEKSGLPYVIENVPGAPLRHPVELCGRMFDLGAEDTDGTWLTLDRHRLFESNWPLPAPPTCRPHDRTVQVGGVYSGARRDKHEARHVRGGGYVPPDLEVLRALLGVKWMSEKELFLAIPPAYTTYVMKEYMKAM